MSDFRYLSWWSEVIRKWHRVHKEQGKSVSQNLIFRMCGGWSCLHTWKWNRLSEQLENNKWLTHLAHSHANVLNDTCMPIIAISNCISLYVHNTCIHKYINIQTFRYFRILQFSMYLIASTFVDDTCYQIKWR